MKTITTRGTVTTEGSLIVPIPLDIPVGEHNVVVVIEELATKTVKSDVLNGLPVHDCGPWPE
ncbi:hypothetical protein GC175_06505 [bacterium]|nr:hypothetical protein [bacterium]